MPTGVGSFTCFDNKFNCHFNVDGFQVACSGKFSNYVPPFFVPVATITYDNLRDFNGPFAILPPPPPLSFVGPDTVDITFTNPKTKARLHLTGNLVPPFDIRYIVVGEGLWVIRD